MNKRFTIKPQDDYFGITDNNTADKVNVINGIRTEIEAKWLCDLLNELYDENSKLHIQNDFLKDENQHMRTVLKENKELKEENEQLKHDATVLICSNQEYRKKNEQLKKQLSEAKADEKQLGISFMGYKMKLIEVLRKKYDKVKGKTLYADVYTEIAEEMGVDLE